jgi:hypothetical protein
MFPETKVFSGISFDSFPITTMLNIDNFPLFGSYEEKEKFILENFNRISILNEPYGFKPKKEYCGLLIKIKEYNHPISIDFGGDILDLFEVRNFFLRLVFNGKIPNSINLLLKMV